MGGNEQSRQLSLKVEGIPELHLLLVGTRGTGKSTLANKIIGDTLFKTASKKDPGQITRDPQVEYHENDSTCLKVVDTPGHYYSDDLAMDCLVPNKEVRYKIDMIRSLALCPNGFHAMLFVVRCDEERVQEDIIATIENVIGDDVLADHTVVVLTHWDFINKKGNIDFQEWCKTRSGHLKELLEKCKFRCVNFDNVTENENANERQLANLSTQIKKLDTSKLYNSDKFKKTQEIIEKNMGGFDVTRKPEDYFRAIGLLKDGMRKAKKLGRNERRDAVEQLEVDVKNAIDKGKENGYSPEMINSLTLPPLETIPLTWMETK